jgi:hypothetical protein
MAAHKGPQMTKFTIILAATAALAATTITPAKADFVANWLSPRPETPEKLKESEAICRMLTLPPYNRGYNEWLIVSSQSTTQYSRASDCRLIVCVNRFPLHPDCWIVREGRGE